MEKWKIILRQFLNENCDLLKTTDWMIMGSMATALQGCNITPNDMDIIMKNKEGIYLLATSLDKYTINESNEEAAHHNDNWRSTKRKPVIEDEYDSTKDCWTFGRWYIDGFKIEAASIIPPEDYLRNKKETVGVWEGGPEIWKYNKYVNFEHYQVPVIPLEIQLETNLRRNLKIRIEEIIKSFLYNSYDKELLNYCLSDVSKKKLNEYFNDTIN